MKVGVDWLYSEFSGLEIMKIEIKRESKGGEGSVVRDKLSLMPDNWVWNVRLNLNNCTGEIGIAEDCSDRILSQFIVFGKKWLNYGDCERSMIYLERFSISNLA